MDPNLTTNSEFNLDFSTLENADVLENFDFDSFLNTSADDTFNFDTSQLVLDTGLDAFYTISEDLAEGKLSTKEKALKLLVKKAAFSSFAREKTNKGRAEAGQENSAYMNTEAQTTATSAEGSQAEYDFTEDPAATYSRQLDLAKEFSKQGRMSDKSNRGFEEDFESIENPDGEESHDVDSSDDDSAADSTPSSLQKTSYDADIVSGKRKAVSRSATPIHQIKRSKAIREPKHEALSASHGEEYSKSVAIVYMVHCSESRQHPALAYEDLPFFTSDIHHSSSTQRRSNLDHVNGNVPIHDLASLLKEEEDGDVAIVVVRHIRCTENQGNRLTGQALKWHESLAIKSSLLRQTVADVAQCYYDKGDGLRSGNQGIDNQMDRITVNPARLFFFHHQHLLIDYVKTHPHVSEHVSALNEFCQKKYAADFQEAKQLFEQGLVSQKHLDKLYLPNTIVISNEGDSLTAYVVSTWPLFDSGGSLMLRCWAWRNNGSGWVRNASTLRVPPIPSSHTTVRSLGIYPLRFATDDAIQMLVRRGRKLWDLKNTSYISYTGHDYQGDDYYPESRFMIDYAVYKKMHQHASALDALPPGTFSHDRWPTELDLATTPQSPELMVMPNVVHGFYLTEKQWVGIFVDGVHPIKWNKTAYDRLVIPPKTKELIRALVAVRTSQRGIKHGLGVAGKRVDIIAGKGNGLIMLLHGGPGTGKSLTAESVAEIAEMPLYRVTCGDIGTTPDAVERYMGIVMHLGVTWNCVLLLDEADVFLEERSMSDLARNSLVSVFLRILEYYDGILILTSNRIGTFDEAFKSRIQVALHYEKLTISSRKKIWTNFIDMLEEDEENVNFEEIRYKLDQLAKVDMNGRQIRNTLTTARQLAIFQSARLDWQHIEQALSVSIEFNDYLQRMQGHTDDQRARDEKIR